MLSNKRRKVGSLFETRSKQHCNKRRKGEMAHRVKSLMGSLLERRWNHAPPAFGLPEFVNTPKTLIPRFSPSSSMKLMAVPRKKVSPYKRGLRNGPKALKPIPVIIRCKCCGRVKLPHFYCCSGDKGSSERSNSTS